MAMLVRSMGSPARLLLLLLLAASNAQAWQVFVQVTSETTLRGSSETSTAASRDEANRDRASNTGADGMSCRSDSDCYGHCEAGVCVDPPATQAQPVPGTQPIPACMDDQSCAIGYACRDQRCVQRTEPPLPPPPSTQPCTSDAQCAPGQSCGNGHCLSPPPLLPLPGLGEARGEKKTSSLISLQRRGAEVYLRERAVQLRQDLALGEGPVISMLALDHRVPAPQLGRTLRTHRAELAALMDDTDATWPARFLERLDALCARPVRVTRR
jgi:hypothetical protein